MKRTDVLRYCPRCASKGLIRVQYASGEPYDVAICDCAAGAYWRHDGEDAVRQRLGLSAEHQVALLKDFGDPDVIAPAVSQTFIEAGRTAKRAKL